MALPVNSTAINGHPPEPVESKENWPAPAGLKTAEEPSDEVRANVLVVDDREDKRLAMETIIADLGENIVKVSSGKEALRSLLNQDFAVILLDVNMPGM